MVVENLKKYVVADYNELWKLYKKGKLGKIEQRISDDLKKMVVGVDGTDEELIIALLCTDTDNVYQVSRCKRGFKITIIEFSISIDFTEKTKKIDRVYINFGEDGNFEEYTNVDDKNTYQPNTNDFKFEIFSEYDSRKKHLIK